MEEKKQEKLKTKCPVCGKKKEVKQWVAKKGLLKGHNMCESIFCNKVCYKRFELLIRLSDVLNALEKTYKKRGKTSSRRIKR